MGHMVVKDLLHVATGISYADENNSEACRVVWGAVLSEINFFLSTLPKVRTKENEAPPEEIFCRILAVLSSNRSCLSRLVQKLIIYDDVMQHKDTESTKAIVTSPKMSPRKAAVSQALESLGMPADQLKELMDTSSGSKITVKHGRLLRASYATEAMNEEQYLAFAEARKTSFPVTRPKILMAKKDGPEKHSWFDALNIPSDHLTPLLQLMLSFLASEVVHLIVDLVHVVRLDLQNFTTLRYKLLRAAEIKDFSGIGNEILNIFSLPLQSVITVDEVRNVFRIFSSIFSNPCNRTNISRRSLLLYF